ncbi:SDR family oxidoreductase [Streptomyces sp. NPDC088847]|uniref:SDR family oxidoreductase n=1 Tax=Streptomyces sp. NPDC088847 TaxID=3365909 RepID=UPI00381A4331
MLSTQPGRRACRPRLSTFDLHVLELDVQSPDSANTAVQAVADEAGGLDVVVHNAAHLLVGYTEAFTV